MQAIGGLRSSFCSLSVYMCAAQEPDRFQCYLFTFVRFSSEKDQHMALARVHERARAWPTHIHFITLSFLLTPLSNPSPYFQRMVDSVFFLMIFVIQFFLFYFWLYSKMHKVLSSVSVCVCVRVCLCVSLALFDCCVSCFCCCFCRC